MRIQAALGSDIALTFDECTPFHADRDYTARSTERTHRWLDRCLDWHEREGPPRPGGLRHRPGRESTRTCAASRPSATPPRRPIDGIAIGGTLGREKEEMHGVLALHDAAASRRGAPPPARDRRDRRPAGRDRDGHRPVRLRDPHSAGAARDRARPRPGRPLPDRPDQGGATRRTTRRSSRAAPARPAAATPAPTSTTWRGTRT